MKWNEQPVWVFKGLHYCSVPFTPHTTAGQGHFKSSCPTPTLIHFICQLKDNRLHCCWFFPPNGTLEYKQKGESRTPLLLVECECPWCRAAVRGDLEFPFTWFHFFPSNRAVNEPPGLIVRQTTQHAIPPLCNKTTVLPTLPWAIFSQQMTGTDWIITSTVDESCCWIREWFNSSRCEVWVQGDFLHQWQTQSHDTKAPQQIQQSS